MFSIVVVYNNEQILNRILVPSLEDQTVGYEFVPLDNTKGKYKSAAEALNLGGVSAHNQYILFVHQDVELPKTWLADTECILDTIPNLGIAGAIGMSIQGKTFDDRLQGHLCNCGENMGKPLTKPTEVQTLDECALIIPKMVFSRLIFDNHTFDNWHCYGADYCLEVKRRLGLRAYAIPAYIYHRSRAQNVSNLSKYHRRLYQKHHQTIYMTTGTVNRVNALLPLLSRPYRKLFPTWIDILKKDLQGYGYQTILDLGCGYNSPIQHFNIPCSTGVDIFPPYIEESQKKMIHSEYNTADIRTIEFKPQSFDIVFASEVLEHLNKEDGERLLKEMIRWARHKVVITTPNGYVYQDSYDNNPYQIHLSHWTAKELRKFGFRVRGMNGLRVLHGYKGEIKYKPTLLWQIVSDITQKVTYCFPEQAFQLLAIKDV